MKNKKLLFAITIATITSLPLSAQCNSCCKRDSVQQTQNRYSPSTLIIWYDATSKRNKKRLMKTVKKYKATVLYDYNNFNGVAIKIPEGTSLDAAIEFFKKLKGVLQVNRDGIMNTNTTAFIVCGDKNNLIKRLFQL